MIIHMIEIAGILCIPIGTVKSRHNQGWNGETIRKLRQYVERFKKGQGGIVSCFLRIS